MPNNTPKNNLLFDFYQNIKSGTEVLSIEDLEVAIKTMELAKEELKINEQKRIQKLELEKLRNAKPKTDGKIIYLPNNLRKLNANAFKGDEEIVKVFINKGLTEIGPSAFEGCTNLREVVFPSNSIILRRGCFKDCSSLKEIFIPQINTIGPSAFENCLMLEKISLPATISNIYSKAFKDCTSLKEVCFRKYQYRWWGTIFGRAFENCIFLETIELPLGLGMYNEKTFSNCVNLKTIYVHENWNSRRKLDNCPAQIINLDAPK